MTLTARATSMQIVDFVKVNAHLAAASPQAHATAFNRWLLSASAGWNKIDRPEWAATMVTSRRKDFAAAAAIPAITSRGASASTPLCDELARAQFK